MIEELLPQNVMVAEAWGDDLAAHIFPEEALQIQGAVESRKREFATTRACARLALAKLGSQAAPIPQGTHREPIWPPGVVGSLTHCRGYRAAAVAKQSDWLALGIDAEVREPLPADVRHYILSELEISWLADYPEGTYWDRVLFSAKESLYKAWFPLTKRWLGFEDVSMRLNPGEGSFHARLHVPGCFVAGTALDTIAGRFLLRDGLVLTAVTIPIQPL